MICMPQSAPVFCRRTTMAFNTLQIFFYVIQRMCKLSSLLMIRWRLQRTITWYQTNPLKNQNFAGFKQHRRDQSTLSLLVRCAYGELRKTFLNGHSWHTSACTRFNCIWPNEWTPGRAMVVPLRLIPFVLYFHWDNLLDWLLNVSPFPPLHRLANLVVQLTVNSCTSECFGMTQLMSMVIGVLMPLCPRPFFKKLNPLHALETRLMGLFLWLASLACSQCRLPFSCFIFVLWSCYKSVSHRDPTYCRACRLLCSNVLTLV